MKILYFIPMEIKEYDGISKKILSQLNSFVRNDFEIDICSEKTEDIFLNRIIYGKEIKLEKVKNNSICRQYLYYNFNKIFSYILNKKIEVIYIRYVYFANPFFIKFLKKLKENNIKVILEIPTYPYDGELKNNKSFLRKIKYKIEEKYRYKMKNYVDRIVTFSIDDEIYGIKTIKINNGIDLEKIKLIEKNKEKNLNEINFIGVAGIAFWHGFDRMILSMAKYYKNNPKVIVKFHVVGDGDKKVVTELKDLVKKNNLEEHVMFYGYKSGKDLDEIYNKVDIAVGSLGFSRIGLKGGSPLKTREYIAKGVPIILGYEDISLKNTLDFIYQVPNDESVFDLYKILDWYKNLDKDSTKIRRYAEDNLTWNKQMKKVVDYILEIEEKEKC